MAVSNLSRVATIPAGWVRVSEAAERYGVSRRTLELWIGKGRINGTHIPGVRQWIVREADLKALFEPAP